MALILENNDENISRAADSIVNNDIVIFPTETVYGIGANAFSKIAIEKIYNTTCFKLGDGSIIHESFRIRR